jgi:trypsin
MFRGLSATIALLWSLGAAGAPAGETSAAAADELKSYGSIQIERDLTVSYRLCPSAVRPESAVVIWPLRVQLKIDMTSASVARDPNGQWHVTIDAPHVMGVSLPVGLADTMMAPVALGIESTEYAAVRQFADAAKIAPYFANRFVAVRGRASEFQSGELRLIVARALQVHGLLGDVLITSRAAGVKSQPPVPQLELCPGSVVMANGVPLLRFRGGQIEEVPADGGLSVLIAADGGAGLKSAVSSRDVNIGTTDGTFGTAFALPDWSGIAADRVAKKIAGGTHAAKGEFPWAVALAVEDGPGIYTEYCGGSLIGSSLVLTAGHCPVREGHVALIGATDLTDVHPPDVEVIYVGTPPAGAARTAPGFGVAAKYDADLQLVYLASKSGKTTANLNKAAPVSSDNAYAIGWGETENGRSSSVLLKARMRVNDMGACRARYADQIAEDSYTWGITSHMICVGGGSTASCNGDSGGPLVVDGKISATVSFGAPCQSGLQAPTLFTKLADFPDFLPSQGKP